MGSKYTTQIVVRCHAELTQWLDHVSQAQGRTRAQTVRWLLTQAKNEDDLRTQLEESVYSDLQSAGNTWQMEDPYKAATRAVNAATQFQLGRITKDEALQAVKDALPQS